MKEESRIPNIVRGLSPCAQCKERHEACWGSCSKYKEWKAEVQKVKDAMKAYDDERNMIYEEEKRRKSWGRTF